MLEQENDKKKGLTTHRFRSMFGKDRDHEYIKALEVDLGALGWNLLYVGETYLAIHIPEFEQHFTSGTALYNNEIVGSNQFRYYNVENFKVKIKDVVAYVFIRLDFDEVWFDLVPTNKSFPILGGNKRVDYRIFCKFTSNDMPLLPRIITTYDNCRCDYDYDDPDYDDNFCSCIQPYTTNDYHKSVLSNKDYKEFFEFDYWLTSVRIQTHSSVVDQFSITDICFGNLEREVNDIWDLRQGIYSLSRVNGDYGSNFFNLVSTFFPVANLVLSMEDNYFMACDKMEFTRKHFTNCKDCKIGLLQGDTFNLEFLDNNPSSVFLGDTHNHRFSNMIQYKYRYSQYKRLMKRLNGFYDTHPLGNYVNSPAFETNFTIIYAKYSEDKKFKGSYIIRLRKHRMVSTFFDLYNLISNHLYLDGILNITDMDRAIDTVFINIVKSEEQRVYGKNCGDIYQLVDVLIG